MKLRAFHLLLLLGVLAVSSHSAETLSVVPDSAQALATPGGRFANLRRLCCARFAGEHLGNSADRGALEHGHVEWRHPLQLHEPVLR
jgi:hypothetical protein